MAQHFLLSANSSPISDFQIANMSEDEAIKIFESKRWASNDGKPVCPNCGCTKSYTINFKRNGVPKKRYKCSACRKQYTVTTGTVFAHHKLPLKTYLYATSVFSNAVKGISALQMKRAIGTQYKTAFVLSHKIRATLIDNQDDTKLEGTVEMDGCYVGKTRPANRKEDRKDLRLAVNQNPNKVCLMVAKQRVDNDTILNNITKGSNRTFVSVVKSESNAAIDNFANNSVKKGSTIHSDGATGYSNLMAYYNSIQGDHSKAYVGEDGECSNQAESFFSRFRRLQYGQCHKISVKYLENYGVEIAYREDNRRLDNGSILVDLIEKAMNTPTHNEWCGYWRYRSIFCVNVKFDKITF